MSSKDSIEEFSICKTLQNKIKELLLLIFETGSHSVDQPVLKLRETCLPLPSSAGTCPRTLLFLMGFKVPSGGSPGQGAGRQQVADGMSAGL